MHSLVQSGVIPRDVLAFPKGHDLRVEFCIIEGMGPRKCLEENRERKHLVQGRRRAGTKGPASLSRRSAEWKQAECEPNTDAAAAFLAN